ncbi:Ring-h2 finger protein [Thalictrum thalictroides]|uniref:RING-type E3 ubiquitin transferase n=1 Tax=Thalictrum thalictroides TaxID=46969 RepID=A0A7J6V089_THATH|nr:Ring-h2 finger protein [Thalictrum thalictroides]
MVDTDDSAQRPSQLLFTPLMIAMIGIVSTALAILFYNYIMTRYCGRRPGGMRSRPIQPSDQKGAGVEEKVLDSIPILAYTIEEGGLFRVDQTECAVCLGEFDEGEVVRLLPSCRHAFHVHCIDEWFYSHSNCPVCRSPIVAPFMSSELSSQLPAAIEENSGSDNDDGVSNTLARVESRPIRVLRPCASVVLFNERKLSTRPTSLKRSMSLDYAYVSIRILKDTEAGSSTSLSPSSSTLKAVIVRNNSRKLGSSRRLDRASSTQIKSYSRLRSDSANGILPR